MKKNRRKTSDEREFSASEPSPTSTIAPPPLEWEEQSQCLGPILRYNSLPLVVTCDRGCLAPMEHVNFDFSQPLLLHTRRTVRKVLASNVVHVQLGVEIRLKEVGDRLLIPEDYKGWFALLGHPGDVPHEKVIPHFRQVAQLALSKCESFLVGGNEPIRAVQMPSAGSGTDSRAQDRLLYPGDVLRMGKLYVGESVVEVKKSLFGGKKTVKKEEKFLLCTDDNDRDLYLPVESRGTFYLLTTEGNGSPKIPIMRMKDICAHFRFPCVVKLIYGRVPSTPCSFTGTLVLRDSQIETSAIGCTLLNLRNILLDLPVDTDLRFFMARSTLELLSSQAYKNAKGLCQDKASTYMRNMKVAYYMNHDDDGFISNGQEEREGDDRDANMPNSVPMLSRPRPSIVDDQELFCPPEATPKPPVMSSSTPNHKKSKKSVHSSEINLQGDSAISARSTPVLRKDQTFNLPAPPESLPLRPSKSSPSLCVENRPLPPIAPSAQCPEVTGSDDHYMSMEETAGPPLKPKRFTPQSVASKTPPTTSPKPRRPKIHSHSESDGCVYSQIWNGEAKGTPAVESDRKEAAAKLAAVLRPTQLNVAPSVHRISSIALADTYLTLPVFKRAEASSTTPGDEYVSPSKNTRADSKAVYINTASISQESCNASEKVIYDVPSSLLASAKQRQHSPSAHDQPYTVMTSTTSTKHTNKREDSFGEERPPTPPPKTRSFSRTLSPEEGSPKAKAQPPVPAADTAAEPHKIVFENPSWMFSDTSSMQSCEYASRWLSSHQERSPQEASHSAYVQMQREGFTYYEGCESSKEPLPEVSEAVENSQVTEMQDSSVYLNAQQAEKKQTLVPRELEATYANIQNLRPCQEKLSVSSSMPNDASDDNHGRFLDKFENPPTMLGYAKAPSPRPATPKKPPPVPKKPSSEKLVVPDEVLNAKASYESGCSRNGEPRCPLPLKPCKSGDPPTHSYLHPCANNLSADREHSTQPCEDSNNATSQRPACVSSRHSDVSQQSGEDDLPLGATFLNFLTRTSDSGCAMDSVADSKVARGRGRGDNSVSSLSVADLGEALKNVGLTKETVEILHQEKVDGQLLVSLDEDELKETLSGIKKLDIKKLQMFIRGWRPME